MKPGDKLKWRGYVIREVVCLQRGLGTAGNEASKTRRSFEFEAFQVQTKEY